MSTKYVFGAVPCRKGWTFVSKIEGTENACLFQTNSSENVNQIMFIYRSIWSLAGRILANQQFFAFASFSRSKVCLRFSMVRKPKNQSCVSKIGLLGDQCRYRSPLVSFKTCRVLRFRLRCKYLCSMFLPRGISVWFQQNTQRLNFRLQVFQKSFVGGTSPIYFSGMRWVKTLGLKKYKSYCFLQKIFFSMKSVEFPQFS